MHTGNYIIHHSITFIHLFGIELMFCHRQLPQVHYIVLLNEAGIKIDHLQRITYKLCYMYYNWPG